MEQTAIFRARPELTDERRTFIRMPFKHRVRWAEANDESGWATLQDVGRTGLRLSLNRYLRPGRIVYISFDGARSGASPLAVPARLVWSRSTEDGENFIAGFEILHDEASTLADISEVFYMAFEEYSAAKSSAGAEDAFPIEDTRCRCAN